MARTNIVLDDKLIKEASKLAGASSMRELVNRALKEFVENHRRKDIRELRGDVKIDKTYNHKLLRD